MKSNLASWTLFQLKKIVNSIAFYPAFIALVFLGLSYLMIHIDYSETGKQIKAQMEWLKLKDASTARSLVSVIAAGILSLTVFSFTMVMVILNQAASQMSNRVLDKLIGNRYQQFVLGFYIGTIVYSLFLLSAIRDIDSGIYVPSLSTYLLIAFAIVDIFLFIYFLHYITQSVKYAVIIRRIYRQTKKALQESCRLAEEPRAVPGKEGFLLTCKRSGIFDGFNKDSLVALAQEAGVVLTFLYPLGSYVLADAPIVMLHINKKTVDENIREKVLAGIFLSEESSIEINFAYGFRQLTEVALKALSPGVNDPGTAMESLRSLATLLAYRLKHFPDNQIRDSEGVIRLITKELSVEDLFSFSILPIWDYGKNDRYIQQEMLHLLRQLQGVQSHPAINKLLLQVDEQIAAHANG